MQLKQASSVSRLFFCATADITEAGVGVPGRRSDLSAEASEGGRTPYAVALCDAYLRIHFTFHSLKQSLRDCLFRATDDPSKVSGVEPRSVPMAIGIRPLSGFAGYPSINQFSEAATEYLIFN